jgi:hypothetical protein
MGSDVALDVGFNSFLPTEGPALPPAGSLGRVHAPSKSMCRALEAQAKLWEACRCNQRKLREVAELVDRSVDGMQGLTDPAWCPPFSNEEERLGRNESMLKAGDPLKPQWEPPQKQMAGVLGLFGEDHDGGDMYVDVTYFIANPSCARHVGLEEVYNNAIKNPKHPGDDQCGQGP